MDTSSKIYVAGHNGLVGSALVRTLRRAGYDNLLLRARGDLDLTSQDATRAFFETEKPEFVFLAAARVGGILANDTSKAEFLYDNIAIATNVIHAAWKCGVRKLLNLGSSCIYPKFAPQPMREESLLTGPLEPTNEPYAIAKIAALKMCRYYNEQYGTDFLSVMPTNLYGEGDNFDLFHSHVLPAMLRKFHLAARLAAGDEAGVRTNLARHRDTARFAEGTQADRDTFLAGQGITPDSVTLWGSGTPKREFLHVDDLAEAGVFLMQRHSARELGEIINVGTGTDLEICELAECIRKTTGFGGEIIWDATKPDGTPRKLLDVSRMHALGWNARISLPDGIAKTYAWYADCGLKSGETVK